MADVVRSLLRFRQVGLVATGFLLLFSLLTLGRIPEVPHEDDGAYASAAFRFWQTGRPGFPGFRQVSGLEIDNFALGRTAAAFQGIFMSFLGVSLFNSLLPSFLAGIGLLMVTYCLSRCLWGKDVAILAMTILAASGMFFLASRWARPDILLTLYFVTALYLFASAPPGKWSWRYLTAGMIMGFSGDIHLNGFLLAPIPLLFSIILRKERTDVLIWSGITYISAVVVGLLVWLMMHYWPDPDAFHGQIMIFGLRTGGIRILKLGLTGAIWGEIQRYLSWFWGARLHRNLFEGLAILTCGMWMTAFGDRRDRALIVAWFLVFIMGVCFMANPFGWYLIYVWPLFAVWLARCFVAIHQTRTSRYTQRRWAKISLFLLFVGYLSNLGLWGAKAFSGPSYSVIRQELRSVIAPKASVVAGGEWWFSLWDRNFTDSLLIQFRRAQVEVNRETGLGGWEGEWRRQRWQFVVAYGDLRAMLDSEVPISEAVRFVGAAREEEVREARAFAEKHCSVIRRIPTADSPVLVLAIY